MPVVPYFQHGGTQVPSRGLLPLSHPPASISSVHLPSYPKVATLEPQPSVQTPDIPRDRIEHAIAITIDKTLHISPSEQLDAPLTNVDDTSVTPSPKMKGKKTTFAAAAGTLISLFTISGVWQSILFDKLTPSSERAEESTWVASSHYWTERKVCTWFGLCGLTHLNKTHWTTKTEKPNSAIESERPEVDLRDFWLAAQKPENDLTGQTETEIPKFVLDHAPLIHLYSGEQYWPCDIAEHLIHTTPHLNYTAIQATDDHPTLANLGKLNDLGRFVYLQSDDNVEDYPEWLGGQVNIPNEPDHDNHDDTRERYDRGKDLFEEDYEGRKANWWRSGAGDTQDKGGVRPVSAAPGLPIPTTTPEGEEFVTEKVIWQPELRNRRRVLNMKGNKVVGGKSGAPAVLIVVPKDNGVVDAFWFFFYSYNLGNAVFNVRFGNHVGDWEHTAIRFQDGEPKAVFYSEHAGGTAYTWDAVEKMGKRPVGYSATGTHAMYATAGLHPYVLPGGILHDVTDRGPLWDPVQNMHSFTYDYQRDYLVPSTLSSNIPVGWFFFGGHWGDKFYPLNDPRQYQFLGQYHYVSGPYGPRFKNLGRQEICQNAGECVLKRRVDEKQARSIETYPDVGEGEVMTEKEARQLFGTDYDSATRR